MKSGCHRREHCRCKVLFAFVVLCTVISLVLVERFQPDVLDYLKSQVIVDNEQVHMHLPGLSFIIRKATDTRTVASHKRNETNHFLACKVPTLSLETDSIRNEFTRLSPLSCGAKMLFYLNNSHLEMHKDIIKVGYEITYCEYRAIERYTDDVFIFSKPLNRTKDFQLRINHDFFMVECYLGVKNNTSVINNQSVPNGRNILSHNNGSVKYPEFELELGEKVGTLISQVLDIFTEDSNQDNPDSYSHQFFAQIHPKKDVLARTASITPHVNSTQMNVLILSLDSISHLNYQRLMPKTYTYLNTTLGATILNGYNIVGDGTMAAFIPFLTGKTESELPDIRKGVFTRYADSYPMIWDDYTRSGYVTMYGEDRPDVETFQMRVNGFNKCPVDHYMRQFWQAVYHKRKDFQDKPWTACLDGIPRHNYIFDYIRDYFVKYPQTPKFALQHVVAMPHSNPNKASQMDGDLYNLLHDLSEEGHLENTLLIVMSDHGSRFDKARGTTQGKLEERLPMMSLLFPKSFQNKYPDMMKNLQLNVDRLSTPFDIHETLLTMLDIHRAQTPVSHKDRGISLLKQIPRNRTCDSAGVDIHWCTCMEYQNLNTTDDGVIHQAQYLVQHINKKIQHLRKLCVKLELRNILDVRLIHPNEKLLKYSKRRETFVRGTDFFTTNIEVDILHYQITIETSPNDALYEATLRGHVKTGSYDVIGTVSRINKYGDQPDCIIEKYPNLRKFCYCAVPSHEPVSKLQLKV